MRRKKGLFLSTAKRTNNTAEQSNKLQQLYVYKNHSFNANILIGDTHVDNFQVVRPGNLHVRKANGITRDSHFLWVFKRINPRSRRGTRRIDPEHMLLSRQANPSVLRAGVTIMQLNVEGLTKAKCAIIKHQMEKHKATAILLQETHLDLSALKISGYNLAACINSSAQGTATFVKNPAGWTPINSSKTEGEVK